MFLTEETLNELPFAITICDNDAKIIYMNDLSVKTFQKNEDSLIGKSLFDCHSNISADKIRFLLENAQSNTYTIEKNGTKKLIHQCPWYKDGKIAGLIEVSIIIPTEMPHFVR